MDVPRSRRHAVHELAEHGLEDGFVGDARPAHRCADSKLVRLAQPGACGGRHRRGERPPLTDGVRAVAERQRRAVEQALDVARLRKIDHFRLVRHPVEAARHGHELSTPHLLHGGLPEHHAATLIDVAVGVAGTALERTRGPAERRGDAQLAIDARRADEVAMLLESSYGESRSSKRLPFVPRIDAKSPVRPVIGPLAASDASVQWS